MAVLSLVDVIMVANVVVMVIVSGHENFVVSALLLTYSDRLALAKKVDAGH